MYDQSVCLLELYTASTIHLNYNNLDVFTINEARNMKNTKNINHFRHISYETKGYVVNK
jgi:hypothetical protein